MSTSFDTACEECDHVLESEYMQRELYGEGRRAASATRCGDPGRRGELQGGMGVKQVPGEVASSQSTSMLARSEDNCDLRQRLSEIEMGSIRGIRKNAD